MKTSIWQIVQLFIPVCLIQIFFQRTVFSQNHIKSPDTNYLLVIDEESEQYEKITIGDQVRYMLAEGIKLEGKIRSIDSRLILFNSYLVNIRDIKKIRKLNHRTDQIVPGAMLTGIFVAGIAVMFPHMLNIGKSKRIIVMSE